MGRLKETLQYVPGIFDAIHFLREPRNELQRYRDYVIFRHQWKRILESHRTPFHGRLLVVNPLGNWIAAMKQEGLLVKGAQLQGLQPIIVTNRGAWVNRYYRLFGVDDFVYLEDYVSRARKNVVMQEAKEALKHMQSFDDLMAYQYHGIPIGNYVASSFVRQKYTGTIDIGDPTIKQQLLSYLLHSMEYVHAATLIYDQYQPEATLFMERGYTPYGEFFNIALQRELNTVQWCGSHREDALTLKRYSLQNVDHHPGALSQKTWDLLLRLRWTPRHEKRLHEELSTQYASGKWFSEVGTQFGTQIFEREKVQRILQLDPSKKTAVIFSHIFWDATFFWGEDLFTDYREWFMAMVKVACSNSQLNWVLKLHPANVVKLIRDGYTGELVEKAAIREAVGTLPPHVKLLEPSSPISTYSLFSVMDYCFTVRGTIGIEAASFGIPVFTAGTGRYDGHGFTNDSLTREEYLQKMSHIHEYPPLSGAQRELAQKFAYGTFILRPFDLKSIQNTYRRDKKATLDVTYLFRSPDDLLHAEDVNAFGQWLVHSRDEDYYNPRLL